MKRKTYMLLLFAAACLFCAIRWMGIGYYSSSSAVLDLKEALTALHGEPYTGRVAENGIEDMEFSVVPDTFFLTNYNLRNTLGLDYRYQCKVTYTVHLNDGTVSVRSVTYTGIDPMGQGKEFDRAYLDTENVICQP